MMGIVYHTQQHIRHPNLIVCLSESYYCSVTPRVPPRIIYSQSIVYSQCTMRVSLGLSARRARRTSQEAQRASS